MAPPWVWRLAYRVYRSRVVAQALFGVKVSPIGPHDNYFDVTSWVLLRRASHEAGHETRVVDLGAGSQAIIGLALWRRHGCPVISVEINSEIAALARANVERNGAPVRVIESHLFSELTEPFDLVVFNPPYVPSADGEERHLPEKRRSQWDGGADGLDIVRAFAAAVADRSHPLRFCLGVNSMHVDDAALRGILESHAEIQLEEVFHHRWLPVSVYVGSRRSNP